jgi:recombinational DNA repair protein (RecF pathway)
MSLHYLSDYDNVVGVVVTEEGKILYKYTYQCYGQSLNFTTEIRQDPTARYYDFYFHDRLTNHLNDKSKTVSDETARYLDLLKQAGYAPNSEIEFIPKTELPPTIRSMYTNTGMIRIRHDLDKCTAQEMFLVGSCVRPLSHSPQMALDYLQLVDLHPEIELSLLYQLSCSISFGDGYRSQSGANVLIDQNFGLLRGKTFIDFYEDVAKNKKPLLRNSHSYFGMTPSESTYHAYFLNTKAQINIQHPYFEQPLASSFNRSYGAKYSPEVIEASLNIEKAKEIFFTTTWARAPKKPFVRKPETERDMARLAQTYQSLSRL